MLSQSQLARLLIELLLLLLGLLLAMLAVTGRYAVPQRSPAWLGLGAFLIYWGARAWMRQAPSAASRASSAAAGAVRGGSLILVGATMLLVVWLPFRHAAWFLVAAGVVLALRGLAGLWLALRTR